MARPGKGRRRSWRFRLNEGTVLEVSATGPTEKQVRRRGRVSLVLGTVIAALMLSAVASADKLDADADALATASPAGNELAANQQPGTTAEYDLSAAIDETGNPSDDVFAAAGDTVVVTIARAGDWLASPAGSPASFSFTSYDSNQAGKVRVTVPCGTTPGTSKAMTAVLTAGASSNGKTLSPDSQTLTYTITAQGADAASCAPANSAPVVTASDDSFSEGTSKSYSASWTDANAGQTHTCTIDFGDGSGAVAGTISPAQPSSSGSCSASHAYADGPNSYTITVNVSDGSASGGDTATATVNNVAPTIALTGAASVDEGSPYTLSLGSVVDPGTDSVSACSIDWGDGTSAESCLSNIGSTKTHTYADGPNGYTIDVDLTDEDGTFASAGTKAITVDNVAPTVVASFSTVPVSCRTTATLTIDPDDAGVNDSPWKVNITWGDGTTEPEIARTNLDSFTVTHVYTAAGSYNATVTVEDKDGGSGSDSTNPITVNQTYTVDFLPPFDDSTPSKLVVNKMKNGRVVPVKATIFDDCSLGYVTDPTTNVSIKVTKTPGGGGTSDPVEEYADAGQSSAGTNLFRWSTDGFWIYNLDSKALGLVVDNAYRVDVYVGSVQATSTNWAVLQPVK